MEPQLGAGAPMSKAPAIFGMRHADGEPENYVLVTGDLSQMTRDSASDLSLIREVPRDEWESVGYEVRQRQGQDVVVQVFDKTQQLIEAKEKRTKSVADIETTKVEDVMKRLEQLEAQNKDLQHQLKNNNVAKANKADATALRKETAASKQKAKAA